MSELKPCAHCGGESELISDNDGHYVRCMCCSAEFKHATKDGAINIWNRRAISREKILLELLGQDTESLGKEAIDACKLSLNQASQEDRLDLIDILKRVVNHCDNMSEEYKGIQYTPVSTMANAIMKEYILVRRNDV